MLFLQGLFAHPCATILRRPCSLGIDSHIKLMIPQQTSSPAGLRAPLPARAPCAAAPHPMPARAPRSPARRNPAPRPGAAVALVAAALRARRALDLRYGGAWRLVHPHAVGRSARGRLALLAWQVADERGTGRPAGWRLFDLARLEALEPRAERFRPQGGQGPRSPIARPIAAA
jgi:hypothetical protein